MPRLFPLCLALLLPGCIDIDLTMDFRDAETVEVVMETAIAREFHDLLKGSGGGPCDGAEEVVGEDEVRCTTRETMTIDALIARQAEAGGKPVEAEKFSVVERLDENRVRVTLDMAQMLEGRPPPEDLEGMGGIVKAAMAGRDFVFRVRGHAIEETTGALSEDGTEAVKVIPMVTFLEAVPAVGPAFVTVVRLEEDCVLWVFCS